MPAVIGLPVSGWMPIVARQRQKRQRVLEIERCGVPALGQARALRLLASPFGLAELDVGAEPAGAERHLEAGLRILAELARAVGGVLAMPFSPATASCRVKRHSG